MNSDRCCPNLRAHFASHTPATPLRIETLFQGPHAPAPGNRAMRLSQHALTRDSCHALTMDSCHALTHLSGLCPACGGGRHAAADHGRLDHVLKLWLLHELVDHELRLCLLHELVLHIQEDNRLF